MSNAFLGLWSDLGDEWSCFRASGADVEDYLHRMTTADFVRGRPRHCVPTLLLTAKGRLIAPLVAWRIDPGSDPPTPRFDLTVPRHVEAQVRDALERLVILEAVEFGPTEPEPALLSVRGVGPDGRESAKAGEAARDAFARACDLEPSAVPLEPYATFRFDVGGSELVGWVRPPGDAAHGGAWRAELHLPREAKAAFVARLGDVGFRAPASSQASEVERIEAGIPRFGADLTEETIPLEAGLDGWISFTKGCFVGQEVVSRMHHLGHPNKRLCRLRATDAIPASATIRPIDGDRDIGQVTSSASSETGSVALGYVGWRHAEDDLEVQVDDGTTSVVARLEVLRIPDTALS